MDLAATPQGVRIYTDLTLRAYLSVCVRIGAASKTNPNEAWIKHHNKNGIIMADILENKQTVQGFYIILITRPLFCPLKGFCCYCWQQTGWERDGGGMTEEAFWSAEAVHDFCNAAHGLHVSYSRQRITTQIVYLTKSVSLSSISLHPFEQKTNKWGSKKKRQKELKEVRNQTLHLSTGC